LNAAERLKTVRERLERGKNHSI